MLLVQVGNDTPSQVFDLTADNINVNYNSPAGVRTAASGLGAGRLASRQAVIASTSSSSSDVTPASRRGCRHHGLGRERVLGRPSRPRQRAPTTPAERRSSGGRAHVAERVEMRRAEASWRLETRYLADLEAVQCRADNDLSLDLEPVGRQPEPSIASRRNAMYP